MKLVVPFIALFVSSTVFSQNQVALFAGPQMSTANYAINNQPQPTTYKTGINAGVSMKVPFDGFLYFAPAVFYSMKGYNVTYNLQNSLPDIRAINNSTVFHSVELAALLQFDLSTNINHLFIKVGPSLDFQLFAHEKFDLQNGDQVSRAMKFGPGEYGRYSVNLLSQLGYETGSFFLFGQFSHSPANLSNRDGGPSIKHKLFGFSIGKYLNRKKIVIDTRNRE